MASPSRILTKLPRYISYLSEYNLSKATQAQAKQLSLILSSSRHVPRKIHLFPIHDHKNNTIQWWASQEQCLPRYLLPNLKMT